MSRKSAAFFNTDKSLNISFVDSLVANLTERAGIKDLVFLVVFKSFVESIVGVNTSNLAGILTLFFSAIPVIGEGFAGSVVSVGVKAGISSPTVADNASACSSLSSFFFTAFLGVACFTFI